MIAINFVTADANTFAVVGALIYFVIVMLILVVLFVYPVITMFFREAARKIGKVKVIANDAMLFISLSFRSAYEESYLYLREDWRFEQGVFVSKRTALR